MQQYETLFPEAELVLIVTNNVRSYEKSLPCCRRVAVDAVFFGEKSLCPGICRFQAPRIPARCRLAPFSYEYYFKKWFSLSCNTSVGVLFRAAYQEGSGNDPIIETGTASSITINTRFTYLNSKWVRLYSSLGIGAAYVGGFAPTFEVVPFGLTVGRKFFFFAEGGIGMEYWGANAGIGYRF